MLSGVFAGVAGGIHVVLLRGASVHSYSPTMSIEVFSHATIGGLSSLWGAATGVFGLRSIQAELGQELKLLLNGVGLLVVLYFMPGGFIAIGGWLRDKVVGPIARRRGIAFGSSVWEGEDLPEAAEPTSASAVGAGQPGIAALSARNIEVSYGQLQVLFGVDFDVRPGEIVALLGTNGAGKSTLLKALCGLVSSSGEIRFESGEVVHPKPERVVASGVALMSGGKSTFPTLTVAEHLRLATWTFHRDANRVREDLERVNTLFPILHARLDQRAGDLSGGEQQQLALAQTLMLRPKVLLIDELSLGLAPSVVGQLLKVVRDLNAEGVTVVVVEQSVNVALTLAERAVFMEKGTVRFEGPTRELLDRPDILRAVFLQGAAAIEGEGDGADTDRSDPEFEVIEEGVMVDAAATDRGFGTSIDPIVNVPYEERPIVLQCRGVSKRFGGIVAVDAVDLTVRAGTIVGLVGQNGAGKTTLLDCISGFHSIDGGLLMLRGADVTQWAPWERSRGRLGRSFQQARLYPSLSVEETIAVATERVLHCRSMIADACRQPASFESEIAVADRVDELIELLNLGPVRRTVTAELSTGTRRIVELACLLAEEPAVLLLDEPSAGVAQREAEALAPLLKTIRDHTGSAMLVIEHDMPFLTGLCDEMVALDLGAVIATGAPAEVLADQRVIDCYLGTDRSAIERSGASENAEALAG
jgi:branched-chain amino acid transport system ATP-binding protein